MEMVVFRISGDRGGCRGAGRRRVSGGRHGGT